jgi:fructuronate reductase/mannitol 2-dehydrogenase
LTAALALRTTTLGALDRRVHVPHYDRTALTPSVVHMSVGSFHRAHQAMYFDELARRGHTAWGLVGIGLRRADMRDALIAQDGLYTVVIRDREADHAQVVGVIRRYLFAPEESAGVLASLADPRTRLVTLTITGDGYLVDPATGRLDTAHPALAADLLDPEHPRTAIGYLVEALDRRRRAGLPPFTVLSCDNVTDNGRMARGAVTALARLRDAELAAWIDEHGAFPSSMVDRITPKTTDEHRRFVAEQFGVADLWPVITEPFTQWIVEDSFCNGRPPLDEVGVRFVDDVRPYALVKTRLLNASHCALGYLGSLAGLRTTDEAMRDPVFAGYVTRLMRDEVAPLLPAVPDLDVVAYRATTLERLANPKLPDQLERLCRAGSGKVPRHVVPSIVAAREHGVEHPLLTLAVAGWLHYLRGTDERGNRVALDDPLAPRLRELALAGGTDPRPLLSQRALFGDLGDDAGFVAELESALEALDAGGVRFALRTWPRSDRRLAA